MHRPSKLEAQSSAGSGIDRRRSPRFALHVPVIATWHPPHELESVTVRERAETEDISAQGALLRVHANLAKGHRLRILHPGSQTFVLGHVARNLGTDAEGLTRLAVEMDAPNLNFWLQMAR